MEINSKKVRILCFYERYGLLSDGYFFYYPYWRFYDLKNITPYDANVFFNAENRFDDCIYVDPRNEINDRNFAKFLAISLARKHKIKLADSL